MNPNFWLPWDSTLTRCPNTVLEGRVWAMVGWWRDWVDFRALPYGGSDIMAQPAFVADVIRACMDANAEVDRDLAKEREAAHKAEMDAARRRNQGR